MRRSHRCDRARPVPTRAAGLLLMAVSLLWVCHGSRATAAPAPGRAGPAAPTPGASGGPATAPAPASPEPGEPEPPAEEPPATDPVEPAGEAPEAAAPGDAPTEPADGSARAPTGLDQATLQELQAQARALQDELFKARARVAVVTSKLFRAKITLQLRSNLERFYEVSDLMIALDGAPVFMQEKGWPTAAGDLFEAYAAPGAHELTISARLVARRDATYKLRIDDTFTVLVPEDSTVFTRLVLRETGNMWRFTKRGRGRHVLTAILRARAKPNARGRGGKAKASVSAGTSRVAAPAGAGDRG